MDKGKESFLKVTFFIIRDNGPVFLLLVCLLPETVTPLVQVIFRMFNTTRSCGYSVFGGRSAIPRAT